jgi:uncharacterized damage-inducible protein DinB
MSTAQHFQLMAHCNQRMNNQLIDTCASLTTEQLQDDMGAFFSSILGTVNHIFVGDIFWLRRFEKHSDNFNQLKALEQFPKPKALNDIIYFNLNDFTEARQKMDKIVLSWCVQELQSSDLERTLTYHNSLGQGACRNFAELLAHLFNHQTHHRGQISALLSQLNVDIGTTDFLIDIPLVD